MTAKRKPGAGAKPKNYSDIEFKKNLTREIVHLDNRELFDRVLSLTGEIAKPPQFETTRLELEIATNEIKKRLNDWFSRTSPISHSQTSGGEK